MKWSAGIFALLVFVGIPVGEIWGMLRLFGVAVPLVAAVGLILFFAAILLREYVKGDAGDPALARAARDESPRRYIREKADLPLSRVTNVRRRPKPSQSDTHPLALGSKKS